MGQPAPLVSHPETGDGFDRPDLTGGEVAGGVVGTVGLHTAMRTRWYNLQGQRTTGARWPAALLGGGAGSFRRKGGRSGDIDSQPSSAIARRAWCARKEEEREAEQG